ncbi:phenylalanine--tRNA ligase subunit beta [bacterium]
MLISYRWLKELVDFDSTAQEIADLLTQHGIETSKIEYLGDKFNNVVAACIDKIEKHPNADKLSLCQVNDGHETYSVVCGAQNIFEGAIILFAKVGATLPGDFKIRKVKIRSIESFGMICSAKELGLADSSAGIMILPKDTKLGVDAKEVLGLDDYTMEIEITPNRGDCLSMIGIARELCAIFKNQVKKPAAEVQVSSSKEPLTIDILDDEKCNRYMALVAENIEVTDSPLWLKNQLRKVGLRPINAIVDVTNYVLFETGHPMHAFAYDKIDKKIIVRKAKVGESLVTLDETKLELTEDDLIIADSRAPIALAGVIGGLESGVTKETKKIVLESAYFSSVCVRRTSKRFALTTDSSYRFERGVDWENVKFALERCAYLFKQIFPNVHFSKQFDLIAKEYSEKTILLRHDRLARITGYDYKANVVIDTLAGLGFEVKSAHEGNYKLRVPSYRNDVNLEIDVIEEIVRMQGYKNIPVKPLELVVTKKNDDNHKFNNSIRLMFKELGFSEVKNYNFSSKKYSDYLNLLDNDNRRNMWEVSNPLSEEEQFMATTRLGRLIATAAKNINNMIPSIKLFEIGKSFFKNTIEPVNLSLNEINLFSGVIAGNQNDIYWEEKTKKVNFYYLSGIIANFLNNLGISNWENKKTKEPYLDTEEAADIFVEGKNIGNFGRLSQSTLKKYGIKSDVYVWEFNLDILEQLKTETKVFQKYSTFPLVERDLSLVMQEDLESINVENFIKKTAKQLLKNINVFDVYRGKPLKENQKNISYKLYFQSDDRTLSDQEVNKIQEKIIKGLVKINVELRQ